MSPKPPYATPPRPEWQGAQCSAKMRRTSSTSPTGGPPFGPSPSPAPPPLPPAPPPPPSPARSSGNGATSAPPSFASPQPADASTIAAAQSQPLALISGLFAR